MSDGNKGNKGGSAPVGAACSNFGAGFDALPLEVLLDMVPYTDVVSAIQMTQTCKALHTLQGSFSFWLLLLDVLKSIRPVPRLAGRHTLDDARQAVMTAHKLYIKWSVKFDATPARSYAIAPRLAANDGESGHLLSWTLMLNDGVHVIHSDIDNRVKLRRIDTGEVVWGFHLKSGALGCLDYAFYEEDIILIFDFPANNYLRRMAIYRYRGPGNCNSVYSLDIANPLGYTCATRANFVRGVYAGCVVNTGKATLTAAVSNWPTGMHVLFEVMKPVADDDPFSTFTDTELLIGFQTTDHISIYGYYLRTLASHMVKTISDVVPTFVPLSPNTTYRVDFQGKGVHSYLNSSLKWRPHFQEVGNGQIRFIGRTQSNSLAPLVMVSTLPWPPTHGPQPGAGNVIVKAPATFFRKLSHNSSRFPEDAWTLGSAKKTIGFIASNEVWSSISLTYECRHVIKLLDIRCGASHGETARDGESRVGEIFSTSFPQWLERHGSPLSLDMDDTCGRMVMSMSDGTLAVIEFV